MNCYILDICIYSRVIVFSTSPQRLKMKDGKKLKRTDYVEKTDTDKKEI